MFFEGRCTLRQFPEMINAAVTAVDNSLETPAQLWEMVSSNVGTTNLDDGYVFRSRGPDGKPDVFWGVKTGDGTHANINTNWHVGYRIFAASNYTPGNSGKNGTFFNYASLGMPCAMTTFSPYNVDNFPLQYWISVKKDRVLLAYRSDLRNINARINLIYLGRPYRLFNPEDAVMCMGAALPYGMSNTYSYIWTSRRNPYVEVAEMQSLGWDSPSVNRVIKGLVMPSRPILRSGVNLRGVMDYYVLPQDGRFRAVDTLYIDGVEHLALEIPPSQGIDSGYYYNQLSPNSGTNIFLIPKD